MSVEEKLAKLEARIQALEECACRRDSMFKKKLGQCQSVPDFDPKILTEHQWKGKKLGHRRWADGSLSWGWDFIAEFPKEVIAVLEKGPLAIGESVFTLGDRVVNVQKEKP